jgi:hypothetical protein
MIERHLPACVLSILALGLGACSAESEIDPLARTSQSIIKGSASNANQDAVVLLSYVGYRDVGCTGTLIAKNLVLTARHCVAALEADGTVTDLDENGISGKTIFTGKDAPQRLARGEGEQARGKELFVPSVDVLVPDVALILLDREVAAPIAPIRLDGGAVVGEELTIVGFGLDENNQTIERRQRSGVRVVDVGPKLLTHYDLVKGEFTVREGPCFGDSGGPSLSSRTGAVVGVVSRVNNGIPLDESNKAATCIGGNTEDVYTDLTIVRDVIDAAFAAAGATPLLEKVESGTPPSQDPASPPAKDGAESAAERRPPASSAPARETAPSVGCASHGNAVSDGEAALAIVIAGFVATRRRRTLVATPEAMSTVATTVEIPRSSPPISAPAKTAMTGFTYA